MSAIIRKGHLAKTEGRIEDAEKHYNDAFKMAGNCSARPRPRRRGRTRGTSP
jgi:hypothetical protein